MIVQKSINLCAKVLIRALISKIQDRKVDLHPLQWSISAKEFNNKVCALKSNI